MRHEYRSSKHLKCGVAAIMLTIGLAACSEPNNDEVVATGDASWETSSVADADLAEVSEVMLPFPPSNPLPAGMPKLAYSYGYSYEAPSAELPKLMREHADLCEQQGPNSCRVMGMNMEGSVADDTVSGSLQLAVAASHARAVSALLEDEAENAGAEQLSANIGSDEVSKQITDTQAQIRARTELRDRLLEVLETRRGSVEELVEAERHVAQVNQEIDQAKSWLAETKGRVAFSRLDIRYAPAGGAASAFFEPVGFALDSFGSIFGWIVSILIMLSAAILPIGAVVWIGRVISGHSKMLGAQAAEG